MFRRTERLPDYFPLATVSWGTAIWANRCANFCARWTCHGDYRSQTWGLDFQWNFSFYCWEWAETNRLSTSINCGVLFTVLSWEATTSRNQNWSIPHDATFTFQLATAWLTTTGCYEFLTQFFGQAPSARVSVWFLYGLWVCRTYNPLPRCWYFNPVVHLRGSHDEIFAKWLDIAGCPPQG